VKFGQWIADKRKAAKYRCGFLENSSKDVQNIKGSK
jgi:hypothetical protein